MTPRLSRAYQLSRGRGAYYKETQEYKETEKCNDKAFAFPSLLCKSSQMHTYTIIDHIYLSEHISATGIWPPSMLLLGNHSTLRLTSMATYIFAIILNICKSDLERQLELWHIYTSTRYEHNLHRQCQGMHQHSHNATYKEISNFFSSNNLK